MGIRTADGREWMTINEAAGFLCVSRRTIYNWMHAKRFQVKRNFSGKRQLLLVDRKAWEEPEAVNQ